MSEVKKLGIWMCHSSVHLVEYNCQLREEVNNMPTATAVHTETANAKFIDDTFQIQTESFNKLGIAIEKYEQVLLFGPVDAKLELINFLKSDSRFDKIKIEVIQTNIMNEDQQHSFVERYFKS